MKNVLSVSADSAARILTEIEARCAAMSVFAKAGNVTAPQTMAAFVSGLRELARDARNPLVDALNRGTLHLSALRNIADVAEKITDQTGSAQSAFIRDEARAAIAR